MKISCDHDGWEIIGPGGGGAQFLQSISPHDADWMFVACDMTGAYVSHDGGKRWRGFNLLSRVDSFSFDSHNPDVVYAGTASTGLFCSVDRGLTWDLLYPRPSDVVSWRSCGDHADNAYRVVGDDWVGGGIVRIRVDHLNPSSLWIALRRAQNEIVLLSSNNGGEDWNFLCSTLGKEVYDLFVDHAEGGQIYLFADTAVYLVNPLSGVVQPLPGIASGGMPISDASWGFDKGTQSPIFYALTPSHWKNNKLHSGIWRSRNRGLTWVELPAPVDLRVSPLETPPHFSHVRACESDGLWIYVSADCCPQLEAGFPADCFHGRYGIVRSSDGGDHFQWVFKGVEYTIPENYRAGWVERDYLFGVDGTVTTGLGVSASQPKICAFGDYMATVKTLDAGETWTQIYCREAGNGAFISNGMDVTTSYGVHFDPFDRHHLVISYTDIGMFHSFDDGKSWHHAIKGVPYLWQNTGYWMVFDPEVQGKAWAAWGRAHDLPRPKMLGPNFQLAQGGVTRTDDGLKNWRVSNEGMPENCVTTHLLLDPASPVGQRTLYAAGFGRGVFKSVDDGMTWIAKNKGISRNLNAWRMVMISDHDLILIVARGLDNGQEVDGALYRSHDAGETWRRIPLPEGVNGPNDLVCDPVDSGRLYLACWPKTVDGEERFGGVWLTEDGGRSWNQVFDNAQHVFGITMDFNEPYSLYINTFNSGAYRSEDRATTWTKLENYDFKWGHSTFISPYDHRQIYLTTFGSSVWRRSVDL